MFVYTGGWCESMLMLFVSRCPVFGTVIVGRMRQFTN
jgi:hypothetical protein